jgi:ketosteroid isomerase-like protein
MSDAERNAEVVGRTWDALESGDREQVRTIAAELVHPECEWTPLLSGVDGRSYRGPEGMVEFFDDWLDTFAPTYDDRQFEQIDDDTVLAVCRLSMEGRESGVGIDREIALIAEFEDGRLRRGRVYDSRAAAVEAASA